LSGIDQAATRPVWFMSTSEVDPGAKNMPSDLIRLVSKNAAIGVQVGEPKCCVESSKAVSIMWNDRDPGSRFGNSLAMCKNGVGLGWRLNESGGSSIFSNARRALIELGFSEIHDLLRSPHCGFADR